MLRTGDTVGGKEESTELSPKWPSLSPFVVRAVSSVCPEDILQKRTFSSSVSQSVSWSLRLHALDHSILALAVPGPAKSL